MDEDGCLHCNCEIGVIEPTPGSTPVTLETYCRECAHLLAGHHQVNDHLDCTGIYVDPVTGEESFCDCSRGCCLEERCPGRIGNHMCCVCID